MPDILRVTTPLQSQEGIGIIRTDMPAQQQQVQIVTDPSRVSKPNAQDVYTGAEAGKFLPNYESNYEMFLELLRLFPDSVEEYHTLLFSRAGQLVSSGIDSGIAQEIASFMELLQMNEQQLLELVKNQLSGSVKFSGPFYDVLRQALHSRPSKALQQDIVHFLKSYDSLSSSQHILNDLFANLESIAGNIPKNTAAQLYELMEPLDRQAEAGQNGKSLAQMRDTILPFLASYVSNRHDFGPSRDFITMFVLNLARYELGTEQNFRQCLDELLTHEQIFTRLPGVDAENLERALLSAQRDDSQLAQKLVSILSKGVRGEAGVQNKPLFENIMRSLLVNESVYMPLLHAVIPAEVAGRLFYSEIWVDPDADEGYRKDGYERAVKMLVKFDVKGLGCFDLVLLWQNGAVDLQLYSPAGLLPFKAQIKTAIQDIASRNDLQLHSFLQEACAAPVMLSEVFPKLYERKNAINVVV